MGLLEKSVFEEIATGYFTYTADHLINFELGQYRFRIGDYRVIFDKEEEKLIILTLGHRIEIYK